eukprot:333946-Chlamydomonas_euryale.AAC.1
MAGGSNGPTLPLMQFSDSCGPDPESRGCPGKGVWGRGVGASDPLRSALHPHNKLTWTCPTLPASSSMREPVKRL